MSTKPLIVRACFSAAISCALAFLVLRIFGVGTVSVFSGFDENFYLQNYYNVHNSNTISIQESSDIVVFDISDFKTRPQVAEVIEHISKLNPAVIGLDVFMQENKDSKDESNNAILNAFSNLNCKIVSPCVFDENLQEWLYPFYRDSIDSPNLLYASPVAFDLFEQYTLVDPRSSKETIAYAVAEEFARQKGTQVTDFDGMCINYRNKEFFPVSSLEDLDSDLIEGKIVLIGDCGDYRDIRSIPFKIMSSKRLPGVINIGYTVNSLLSTDEYCDNGDYSFFRKIYNKPFKKCSTVFNVILSFLLCLILSLFMMVLAQREVKGIGRFRRICFILLTMISVILSELLIVVLCFEFITSICLRIPDILLFMTSLLFVDTGIKIVEVFNDESSEYLDI